MGVLNMPFVRSIALLLGVHAQADYYYEHWCRGLGPDSLQFLDDAFCVKKFPSLNGFKPQDFECPISHYSIPDGYFPDSSMKDVAIDVETLVSVMATVPNTEACAILTKRVEINGQKKLFSKYFCNGESS